MSGRDWDLVPGQLAAQLRRLGQREADLASAADIAYEPGPTTGVAELKIDELDQVGDME